MGRIPGMLGKLLVLAVLVAGSAASAVIIGLGGAGKSAAPGGAGQHRFIDCSRAVAGDGTPARPWNRLEQANRARFGPGSWLLLRRGSSCSGSLALRGSGSAQLPIVIGAYARGPRPRIQTEGAAPDALRLVDDSHVVVQDLELTNHGDYDTVLRGIHLAASRMGTVHDVRIRRVYVHDVLGTDAKGPGGTGGIQVDDASSNIVIEDNVIEHVNRSGIWVAGAGLDPRPSSGHPWPSATTGVLIERNIVRWVGGDGIVPTGTVGAIVTDNFVCCGNLRGRAGVQFDAGIWTFDANDTLIERNVVIGMANARADGTGYDVDFNQSGTVVRSNYGYANAGGFILLCAAGGPSRKAEVAFNLSVAEFILSESSCGPPIKTHRNLTGVRIYNNTFLTPSPLIWHDDRGVVNALPDAGKLSFFNNVIVASTHQRLTFRCGHRCSHNLFWRLPPSGASAIEADPRFSGGRPAPGGRAGLGTPFRLRPSSPARAAGLQLPSSSGPDYFGDSVPTPPSLGFDQFR